jgi:hypothetical protein
MYLKDRRTHTSYVVDTWAVVSLLLYPAGPKIVKASGEKIPSWSFVQKIAFWLSLFYSKFFTSKS